MEPTLSQGNLVIGLRNRSYLLELLDALTGWPGELNTKRGDLVIARNPHQPTLFIAKRVVGLEGDRIPPEFRQRHRLVPAGHAWLQGDNIDKSVDSRTYGPVPLGLLQARLVARLNPAGVL